MTWQRATLARKHGREEEGGPPTQQRPQTARGQGSEGATTARPRATPACSQEEEEDGDPPELQRVQHARARERGGHLSRAAN